MFFWRRVHASAVNCSLIIVGSLPLLPLLGRDYWRYALLAICFGYHWICRRRCLGNLLSGLRNSRPLSLCYCALYTAGFGAIFYAILIPFDLLALYILAQLACLRTTGSTIPGYLTGTDVHESRSTNGSQQTSIPSLVA